jgi:pyroglutamyl-peptidase I
MKILVTGFESLGNDEFSPSVDIVKMLPIVVEDAFVVKLEVPALFVKSITTVTDAIDEHNPEAVICVGQFGGRFGITPEFVAINYINSHLPDNAGNRPQNKVVSPDGPAAYITDLPINGMVTAIKEAGVPAEVSYAAGTSLSNSLMYGVARHIEQNRLRTISGFLHIPYIPSQTVLLPRPAPSLSTDDIRNGIEAAIGAVAMYLRDRQDEPVSDVSPLSSAFSSIDINNLHRLDSKR